MIRSFPLTQWACCAALSVLLLGCPKPCDSSSCADGCCDSKNVCRAQTDQACGALGKACTACAETEACSEGACVDRTILESDAGEDAGVVDAGMPPCRIDDECAFLDAGMRCEANTGACIAAMGCNSDNNCPSTDESHYCYIYGLQCRCVTESNDAGTAGVCRRRRGVCDECTTDEQCGTNNGLFDPPGRCQPLKGDATGKKYCFQAQNPTCACGMVNDNGYCKPQSNSCAQIGCASDKECPAGAVCSALNGQGCGLCEPRCRWDFQKRELAAPGCPPGRTCWVDSDNLDPSSVYFGAGRCRMPCTGNNDCTDLTANPFGGANLKCAAEKLSGGAMSEKRCRAGGECMDNFECPDAPQEAIYLGYCDRGTFACKTDCRVGADPVTSQNYADCRDPYKCVLDGGVNVCQLKTCNEQGGARIACNRGQYCCGEDKNGDGVADPCPALNKRDPNGCYTVPSPPFCYECQSDLDCRNYPAPTYLQGSGACANGSKSPSCSPLPNLCLYAGNRPDDSEGVNICMVSTYNDNSTSGSVVPKDQRGCPFGYSATVIRPKLVEGDNYCDTNADCSVGHDGGMCAADPALHLRDGGVVKVCMCTQPGLPAQCPNSVDAGVNSVCRSGLATPTICVQSVVCMPARDLPYRDAGAAPNYGCGL